MKPEEIDRLFREELEKLEQVPGVEWNDQSAWDKITVRLKGGWNAAWTSGLSVVIAVTSVYLIYHTMLSQEDVVVQQKVIPTVTPVIKTDTLIVEKQSTPVIKNKYVARKVLPISKPIDSTTMHPTDSVVVNQKIDSSSLSQKKGDSTLTEPFSATSSKHTRYKFLGSPEANRSVDFTMPRNSVFRLKVNNGLNLSNLMKSIKAEKNAEGLHYIYEYDASPPSFHENTRIGDPYHNKQIITNFKKE